MCIRDRVEDLVAGLHVDRVDAAEDRRRDLRAERVPHAVLDLRLVLSLTLLYRDALLAIHRIPRDHRLGDEDVLLAARDEDARVTVRLDGNNGVHLAEVRVEYAFGSAGHIHDYAVFSWILSELNGWLDGDSDKPPSRTYHVASASPAVEGSGTAIVVDTVTGTANHADSGGTFTISFFGSNGHTVPAVLSAGFQAGVVGPATWMVCVGVANQKLWFRQLKNQ